MATTMAASRRSNGMPKSRQGQRPETMAVMKMKRDPSPSPSLRLLLLLEMTGVLPSGELRIKNTVLMGPVQRMMVTRGEHIWIHCQIMDLIPDFVEVLSGHTLTLSGSKILRLCVCLQGHWSLRRQHHHLSRVVMEPISSGLPMLLQEQINRLQYLQQLLPPPTCGVRVTQVHRMKIQSQLQQLLPPSTCGVQVIQLQMEMHPEPRVSRQMYGEISHRGLQMEMHPEPRVSQQMYGEISHRGLQVEMHPEPRVSRQMYGETTHLVMRLVLMHLAGQAAMHLLVDHLHLLIVPGNSRRRTIPLGAKCRLQ